MANDAPATAEEQAESYKAALYVELAKAKQNRNEQHAADVQAEINRVEGRAGNSQQGRQETREA